MNLLLLLLFSWLIFSVIFHRYHSGQYYSPEGFQAAPEGKNTNKDVKNNKKPNIAGDIITSVNNKNTSDEKLDIVEEEEQVEVDNSDKELWN